MEAAGKYLQSRLFRIRRDDMLASIPIRDGVLVEIPKSKDVPFVVIAGLYPTPDAAAKALPAEHSQLAFYFFSFRCTPSVWFFSASTSASLRAGGMGSRSPSCVKFPRAASHPWGTPMRIATLSLSM